MKILFVTSAKGIDYESDCLFHGLVNLGHEVTDTRYLWYLSKPLDEMRKHRLYGMGFSLAGLLPDRSTIDRDGMKIRERIEARYYDAVVYGSIDRCDDYFDVVTQFYPKERIAIIDGEDDTTIRQKYEGRGLYFKRELMDAKRALPISFAIPKEKFENRGYAKERNFASLVPGCRDTYTYRTEEAYYDAYRVSRFAFTWKKAGWDCLRHYEIVAAGCLPFFIGIENCPSATMTNWPKDLQRRVNLFAARWMAGHRDETGYFSLLREFVCYAQSNLTTESLARYVLDKIGIV